MTDFSPPSGTATAQGATTASTATPQADAMAEWPAKAADMVELAVAAINDRAVRPVLIAARAVVFGVLIAVLGVALVVWGSIGLVRLLDVYLWPGKVWASYLLLGALFIIGGMVAWWLRINRSAEPSPADA
jgi:hypothetical protein